MRTRVQRNTVALGLAALLLLVCQGCNGESKTTSKSTNRTSDADDTEDTSERKEGKLFSTDDVSKVAGVDERGGDKRQSGVRPVGDVRFALYDVGTGSQGLARTTIYIFPESSRKYKVLVDDPEGAVVKRIKDEDMRDLLEAASEAKFMDMMTPMDQNEVDAVLRSGTSVITLESPNGMRGAPRPRLREGATQEDIELWSGMEQTFIYFSEEHWSPVATSGTGTGQQFKQPTRNPRLRQ